MAKLSARVVATATKPGRHADGDGLAINVTARGARSWVFMWKRAGRRREWGLGQRDMASLPWLARLPPKLPEDDELVATPFRHGGKTKAEAFFMRGMGDALAAIRGAAADAYPVAIYYAFKQSEASVDGAGSAG